MENKKHRKIVMLAHAMYRTDPRIRREAEGLVERGHEVHIISLAESVKGVPEPKRSVLKGVNIHRLPVTRKRGSMLRYVYEYFMVGFLGFIKITLMHLQGRIASVHVHNMPDLLVLAGIVPRLTGSRLVLDIHDPMPELYRSWGHSPDSLVVRLLALQERFSSAVATTVISVNNTMREILERRGVPAEKIYIVHNFPDQTYFPVWDALPSWPRTPGKLVILYCGTVTDHYDLGLAVRAMARLSGRIPITLRILGGGNKLAEVLELAVELGVRDSIELLSPIPVEEVAAEMRKADIGLSCHKAGIFGDLYFSTKIVEYLTQGLCVVSPRTYTIARYLSDDCVYYFEPGNAEALAETIERAWSNPSEVVRRLQHVRQDLSSLSWQEEKVRFVEFYGRLLNDERPLACQESTRTPGESA